MRIPRNAWNALQYQIDHTSFLPSQRFARLNHGRWVPPPRQPYEQKECEDEWGITAHSDEINGGDRRALAVAAFRWQPVQEGGMREWSGYEFVKRLLNSQTGLLVVGDSLSQQFVDTLWYMLPKRGHGSHALKEIFEWSIENNDAEEGTSDKRRDQPPKTHQRKIKPQRLDVSLVKDSPWLAPLRRELPNVPSERFSQPFLRFILDDTLVGVERISELAAQLDLPLMEIVPRLPPSEPWRQQLPSTQAPAKKWRHEQNVIVMLNKGAHINQGEMNITSDGLDAITALLARDLLSDLVQRPNLDIVYQGTSPGHVGCVGAHTPMYPSTPFEDHPTYKIWDWGRFDLRNNLWANEMDRLAPRGRTVDGSGSVAYMNVTDMARQRPEAHFIMSPGSPDCLH
ncbi:BQ2448_6425 [Microbotryum intermedium]|uniref:BQ2448_6425 protein n=1 Tax=Microbotryum intermedium TaxID=269621 RepID=A0A238FLF4_9BASI|nr:BQ2448_6425 [Microbotryum intermedium]